MTGSGARLDSPRLSRLDRYTAAAVLAGALGVGWRIWLTAHSTPNTNSDEATMGLAALHIGEGRELPIYFYGQHYMGTVEAYLAAPLVALTGPSVTALRIPNILLFASFLALMFVLVRRLFSPGLAAVTVGLLALGSDRVVKNQLIAGGGYPESAPMVAGLLLLTYGLMTRRLTSAYAYAGWGLTFGLIVWNHWLPAPYLAGALAALLAARVLTRRMGVVVLVSALVGALPLVIDNLTSSFENNSVAVFLGLNGAGSEASLFERIVGGAWFGLPMGMGLCAPSRCEGWSLWWGPVVVALLVAAVVLAVRGLRRLRGTDGDGDERAREVLRLVLAAGGLLSLLSYLRSPAAADTPIESARYLALLGIALPAALWPLWRVVRARTAWAVPAALPVCALALTMLAASVALARQSPGYESAGRGQQEVVAALAASGYTYVHGEYWTCNWISYLSAEQTVCGVVDDRLDRGFNRYSAFWKAQAQAVVAPAGSALDAELARRMPTATPALVGGYRIYPTPTAP
ncbi:hypothetical protein AB0B66_35330 [Catellatospora sp. NPDC049111]|uniref:hypothetical protein n=1 Tax=Catellatospora sp. NPDC049111 TaxID=3155271 RepID=UPI0033F46F4B